MCYVSWRFQLCLTFRRSPSVSRIHFKARPFLHRMFPSIGPLTTSSSLRQLPSIFIRALLPTPIRSCWSRASQLQSAMQGSFCGIPMWMGRCRFSAVRTSACAASVLALTSASCFFFLAAFKFLKLHIKSDQVSSINADSGTSRSLDLLSMMLTYRSTESQAPLSLEMEISCSWSVQLLNLTFMTQGTK